MNNFLSTSNMSRTDERGSSNYSDMASHVMARGHFREKIEAYQDTYRNQFPGGWGEFFAAYSKRLTPKGNLDYDEWAFLCEHFMEELTQSGPPGDCDHFHEKPESTSGFFIGGSVVRLASVLSKSRRCSCRLQ
jgi:hypothetical protein